MDIVDRDETLGPFGPTNSGLPSEKL
jgi:hypothetical protein